MCTLGFVGIGTRCAIGIGAGAPPPGPPGPPGPLPVPPGPPGPPPDGGPGPVRCKAASKASLMSQASAFVAPPPGAAPPPVPLVPAPLVVAAGAVGVVVVVVDVMAIVADPIVSFGCFIKGKGLQLLVSVVGVIREVQGSLSSLCVLPGPLVSIVAGAYLNVVSGSCLSSVVESSAVGSSGWLSSATSVVWTSARMGPKNG